MDYRVGVFSIEYIVIIFERFNLIFVVMCEWMECGCLYVFEIIC